MLLLLLLPSNSPALLLQSGYHYTRVPGSFNYTIKYEPKNILLQTRSKLWRAIRPLTKQATEFFHQLLCIQADDRAKPARAVGSQHRASTLSVPLGDKLVYVRILIFIDVSVA